MANITVQQLSQLGVDPNFIAADVAGDTPSNDGRTVVHVKNDGSSPIDVTIDSVEKCNQGFDHNLTVSIPAGDEKIIGPFDIKRFNNENSRLNISYSAVTSVTVAAYRI